MSLNDKEARFFRELKAALAKSRKAAQACLK
jgi:hypothetical protein